MRNKIIALLLALTLALIPTSAFGVTKATTIKYIKHYASVYRISKKQAVAIARFETGHFTSYACRVKNNVGGMTGSNGLMWFKTRKAGCKAFCRNIRRNYYNCGRKTIRSMSYKYCPSCPDYWTRCVKSLMR